LLAAFVQANKVTRHSIARDRLARIALTTNFQHLQNSSVITMAKRKDKKPIDRSPVTDTAATTSEEVLAVANDTAEAARRQPSHEEIAAAAYERYLTRGAADGQDYEDWLAAERELSERRGR
jgi:hypothetical protein